jgi:hypothetical protein
MGAKAMDVEYKALLGFLLLWTTLFIYVRFVAPRRRLRRFREQMASWNWREQPAEKAPGWQAFEKVAVEGVFGQDRQIAYEGKIGFLKAQVELEEKRSATLRTPVFTSLGKYPRLAACVTSRKDVKKQTRSLLPFWGPAGKRRGTVEQLWIGEVRPFPIRKHILLYSGLVRFGGDYFREKAAEQSLPPGIIPTLASSIKEIEGSELLRQIFQRHRQTLDAVMPEITLAPDAWVLTASLASAVDLLPAIDSFSIELSKALDALSRDWIRDTGRS